MKAPYRLDTPAQIRSFRLLTLAQMVYLERIGLGVTHTTARKQALEALNLDTPQGDGPRLTAEELVARLRDAATKSIGLIDADAPTKPIPPQAADMEPTL